MLENWIATHNNHRGGKRTPCVQVDEWGPSPLVCDDCRDGQTAHKIAFLPAASRLLSDLYHQLSTDADLYERCSRPDVYEAFCESIRAALAVLDPENGQLPRYAPLATANRQT